MNVELGNGILYATDPNGKQFELGDISNGLVEIDALSSNETPDISYNFIKDINTYLQTSFEMSAQNLSFLYTPTFVSSEKFYIESDISILTQARWHKKKRINKKWLKRYGMKHDTVKMKTTARTLSYDTETGECEFETDKLEYIWRPDQMRKNLKIEM